MSHIYRSFLYGAFSILITLASAGSTRASETDGEIEVEPDGYALASETDGEIEVEPDGYTLASETDGEIEVEPDG
ncbi:MAG: hypothetical protein AAF657_33715, partial [Acidobacteriota bacterium]